MLPVAFNRLRRGKTRYHQRMIKPVDNILADNLLNVSEIHHHAVAGVIRIIHRLTLKGDIQNV